MIARSTILLAAVCLAAPGASLAGDPQAAVDLAVVGVAVVDVEGGVVLHNRTLRIRGDRIVDLRPTAAGAPPSAARCLDGRGLYAIPGLWDMHVHALWDRSVAGDFLTELARHGVSGIRDMGGTLEVLEEIRGAPEGARRGWPRIVAAGPILDGPEPIDPSISLAVGDAEAAIAAVDEVAARGVDFVKVYTLLPREAFLAVVERAGQLGLPVAGHVPAAVTVRAAVRAGLASIEHLRDELGGLCHELAPLECEALIAELAAAKVHNTPTLAVLEAKSIPGYRAPEDRGGEAAVPEAARALWETAASGQAVRPASYFARRRQIFREELSLVSRLHRAGVPILAGSDTGSPWIRPGRSLHRELELLVEAGLAPRDALHSATVGAAGFLGLEGSVGQLREGFDADLVLLAGDPLADISNVGRIAAVVLRGRTLAPAGGVAARSLAVAPCRGPRGVP